MKIVTFWIARNIDHPTNPAVHGSGIVRCRARVQKLFIRIGIDVLADRCAWIPFRYSPSFDGAAKKRVSKSGVSFRPFVIDRFCMRCTENYLA